MLEQFHFNRRERRGVFILLVLVLFTQVFKSYVNYKRPVPIPQITYLDVCSLEPIDRSKQNNLNDLNLKSVIHQSIKKQPKEWSNMNEVWNKNLKSGIKPKLESTTSPRLDNPIQDKTSPVPDTTKSHNKVKQKRKNLRVDINQASMKRLMEVNGIGPVLSKRIVKYRNLIGGFHSVNQLEEVYGIDQEVLDGFRKQLWFNKNTLNRINIFTASVDSLSSHFYISERTARTIKDYIESNEVNEVTADEILSLDGVWYESTVKAIPYLILNRFD